MEFQARSVALALAPATALVASVLLWAFGLVTPGGALWAFLLVAAVTFGISFYVLESRVFRKLNSVLKLVGEDHDSSAGPRVVDKALLRRIEQTERDNEELRKQEAFRKDFIADIGHELKTPIFAAQGFVHTLLDGAVKDKSVRKKFLKKAARSLDGLDRLVQDLLTLSQIETGKVKMQFALFDIFNLAEDVIDQFEDKAERKSVDLRTEGAPRTLVVYGDIDRIRQVITNLISNAINYTPPGGTVRVSFRVTSDFITTHVRDTGVGIPGEHLDRVFQRFYRVEKSRNRERGGTGLGLAIVKHILEGHGSRAEVVSAPGKGSDFSFRLPRREPEGGGTEL
jgi:two-component system phosphate regulon sensor histidine kinase PhoR